MFGDFLYEREQLSYRCAVSVDNLPIKFESIESMSLRYIDKLMLFKLSITKFSIKEK